MSSDCEIIDIQNEYADCGKSCLYSGIAMCALVPFSIVAIAVGHLPIAGVIVGQSLVSFLGGTSFLMCQKYKKNREQAIWDKSQYQEINRSEEPLRDLPRKIDADAILRTILVDPTLHQHYNFCLSYIAKQSSYQDRIHLIRTAIDKFSQQVHYYYHIKQNLTVYETCEDMIMNVVYREVFSYCVEYTSKDDRRFVTFKNDEVPDIPKDIQSLPHLDCVASMLNSLEERTSSRDKIKLIQEVIDKAPPNSSVDDLIVFLSVAIQLSGLVNPYAHFYFMKAFLNLDPRFCRKGKTAYCLNLWFTAITYLSHNRKAPKISELASP